MSNYKNQLINELLEIPDSLYGITKIEYKNYILGFIPYKYFSEKIESYLDKALTVDKLSFEEAWGKEEFKDPLMNEALDKLGYFLEPQYLFKNIISKAGHGEIILDDLDRALRYISDSTIGNISEYAFENLFEDVDLKSPKIGRSVSEKNRKISQILLMLANVDFKLEYDGKDDFGDVFEYLISIWDLLSEKRERFYTPPEISTILAKIVTLDKNKIRNVYDPTCGSASSLLHVAREVDMIGDFYGQELNQTTYNIARMNMLLHNIHYYDFDIKQGDSLENPHHMNLKFEAIVANPTFAIKWSADKVFLEDERFMEYGILAPKSKPDYAFIQHMLYHLDENGTMGTVTDLAVLFKGASQRAIRKYLIAEKNYIDAVIGLPEKLFYGTSVQTCILIFKKSREKNQDILFIDASKEFEKCKKQNKLRHCDINKIVNTYKNREEIEKYSHKASLEEIKENNYSLNILRYIQ